MTQSKSEVICSPKFDEQIIFVLVDIVNKKHEFKIKLSCTAELLLVTLPEKAPTCYSIEELPYVSNQQP